MDKIKRDVFLLEDEKVYNKLDELVEENDKLKKRMDNHIIKHKDYNREEKDV